jgi:hypothetical protein
LALLAVVIVVTVHGLFKLLLPFRLLRGLFRHKARPPPLTAR